MIICAHTHTHTHTQFQTKSGRRGHIFMNPKVGGGARHILIVSVHKLHVPKCLLGPGLKLHRPFHPCLTEWSGEGIGHQGGPREIQ